MEAMDQRGLHYRGAPAGSLPARDLFIAPAGAGLRPSQRARE